MYLTRCDKCRADVIRPDDNYCSNCGKSVLPIKEPQFNSEAPLYTRPKAKIALSVKDQKIIDYLAKNRFKYPKPQNEQEGKTIIVKAIETRRGQKEFRRGLLDQYGDVCLITGPNTQQILEAAHIRPYSAGGTFEVSNGLLLRADIHTLFDLGLIAVDTRRMTVLISPSLAKTSYRDLNGKELQIPKLCKNPPDKKALDEHRQSSGL